MPIIRQSLGLDHGYAEGSYQLSRFDDGQASPSSSSTSSIPISSSRGTRYTSVAAIVGALSGGVVAFACLVLVLVCVRRRHRKRSSGGPKPDLDPDIGYVAELEPKPFTLTHASYDATPSAATLQDFSSLAYTLGHSMEVRLPNDAITSTVSPIPPPDAISSSVMSTPPTSVFTEAPAAAFPRTGTSKVRLTELGSRVVAPHALLSDPQPQGTTVQAVDLHHEPSLSAEETVAQRRIQELETELRALRARTTRPAPPAYELDAFSQDPPTPVAASKPLHH
jgi:hypothetical protein